MNKRDTVLALLALGATPLTAKAQQARKLPVIGFLHPGFPPPLPSPTLLGLRESLRQIGYVEGENIVIEPRFGLGKPETLPGLAAELVQHKVDVIVAVAPPAVKAAKQATRDLPIIAVDLESDPVASGFVAHLARPGGNLTGLFLDLPDLSSKWIQLVREVLPSARRLAVLWDVTTGEYQLRAITASAKLMSVELQVLKFRDSTELENALSSVMKQRPQALIQLGSPLINQSANRIVDVLATHRLPGISPFRLFPERGGLMSYGPNLSILYRQLAPYISKILRGAKVGDLPVEQPTNFELIVNLKTAKALGITLPPSILVRADEVIQ